MYRFVWDEQYAIVHVYEQIHYSLVASFRMPRDCNSLGQFKERFYSYSPTGKYRVEANWPASLCQPVP